MARTGDRILGDDFQTVFAVERWPTGCLRWGSALLAFPRPVQQQRADVMEEWEIERDMVLARVGEAGSRGGGTGQERQQEAGDEDEEDEELEGLRKRALEQPEWPPRKTFAKLTAEQKSTLQQLSAELIDTITGGNPALFEADLVKYKEVLMRRKNCYALSDCTTPPPRESL